MLKCDWEYSLDNEVNRLLHSAHQISVGFFRTNNFLILPYPSKQQSAQIATFPDLKYRQIPHFWKRVSKIEIVHFPLSIEPSLFSQTRSLLLEANLPAPNFQKTKNLWQKTGSEIIQEIYKIMPEKRNSIKKMVIHPTKFGTSCSFGLIEKGKGLIEIYLREDGTLMTLTEAILTSLTRKDVHDLRGLWSESEILVDWLLSHSSLTKIFDEYVPGWRKDLTPTVDGIRSKQQTKLKEEAESFSHKLGISSEAKVFSLNGLTPEIYHKPLENLSQPEITLLRKLIQNANQIVTTDELADLLFTQEERFSLYALAKTMQRLREKLEANGISGSYIQTLRRQGYLLKN